MPRHSLSRLEPLIGHDRFEELQRAVSVAREQLRGKTIWNINSTATGGGVAEMLLVLVGYMLDADIDVRWLVIKGDEEFFAITKRIHNRLHGMAGDKGDLGQSEAAHYSDVSVANASSAAKQVRPGDIVLLHDPQTAGMAAPLVGAGARVVWRSHIGCETSNEWTDQAWSFLRGHLAACSAYVFSVASYVPTWVEDSRAWVIPPSIDPFSPKNQEMGGDEVMHTLRGMGLLPDGDQGSPGKFTRRDGSAGLVRQRASILSAGPSLDPGAALVVQVSRWDKLKDMAGVMNGFASYVVGRADAQLALVGPSTAGVTDDPEGADVFSACVAAWEALPSEERERVRLVTLPMDDVDENAAMVNALQRHATVIVQKSLAEGFGLTVAEGMWKARAVLASRVGGIAAQIAPGTGLLLEDPTDLSAFGEILAALLAHPAEIAELGAQARRHVLDGFVGDEHLMRYAHLIAWLLSF